MKKNILISSLLIVAAAVTFTSCTSSGGSSSTTVADNSTSASDNAIPEKDDDGNKIEVIEVTDAAGAVVKDENDKPVTELAIVDSNGVVITDANGQNAKPNISSNGSNNNSNNSNNSNNNSSNNNNNSSNSNNAAEEVIPKSDPVTVSEDIVAFLWFGNSKAVNGKAVFQEITSDSDVIEMTFKVKDSAKNGKYEIRYIEDSDHSSSFCDQNVNSLPVNFCSGYIGVGEDVSTASAGNGLSFVISSAKANPGDTVTLTCSLKNVSNGIVAFNSYFAYDANALEPVSITALSSISEKGEFTTSLK